MNKRHNSIKPILTILSKSNRTGAGRAAFSIIEMASVLAILILIIGATIGAFLGWLHGAAVRGAEDQVHAALAHTRQFALTRRVATGLALGVTNAPGYPPRVYLVAFTNGSDELDYTAGINVSEVSWLPLRSQVSVSNAWQTLDAETGPFVVRFLPDGRSQPSLDSGPTVITIGVTRNGTLTARDIRLDPLTGIPKSLGGAP